MTTVDLSLDLIYVDPTRVSGRAQPVVESYRERLVAALADGATLPPLKVAPLADPYHPWYVPAAPHNRANQFQRHGTMRQRPYSHLPAYATHALYDGHCTYWALRDAGLATYPVQVHPAPVGPDEASAEQALRLLHLQANINHGQALTDDDIRRAFVLLWLGRKPTERETWSPGPHAIETEAIAAQLGRSSSWISQMKLYAMVTHAISLDLGISRAGQIGRLDADLWRLFVWDGDQPRLHPARDSRGRQVGELVTADKLTAAQLKALVEEYMDRPTALTGPRLTVVGDPADDERVPEDPIDPEPYQEELPLDWSDVMIRAEYCYGVICRLSNNQLLQMLDHVRPAVTQTHMLYQGLEAEARRRRLDLDALYSPHQEVING